MSLIAYFISYVNSDELGDITVKEIINEIKKGDGRERRDGQHDVVVDFTAKDGEKAFYVKWAGYELVLAILWGCYIYCMVRHRLAVNLKKSVSKKHWEQMSDTFLSLICNESGLEKTDSQKNWLMMHTDKMVDSMLYNITKRNKKQPSESISKQAEAVKTGQDELLVCVKQLVEENAKLKEQIEMFRNKEKGTALGLNQAQAALFGLSLAKAFNFSYTNKKKALAPMLHGLFGWGEAKIAVYLSTPCENDERDALANLFKDLCPRLYATIMNRGELPPEFTSSEEKVTPSER